MTRLTSLCLAAALSLSGCIGPLLDTSPDGITPIRFLLFGGPEELAAYERLADAFHDANPLLAVEVQTVAKQDHLLARLTTAFAAGSPPDVFLINFRKYGLYAEQGVLAPVQSFIDASDAIDLGELFPAPLDAFRFDGTDLTCLPQNVSSLVTYVNLDLFEAAGVDLPTDSWNWEEFRGAAAAISAVAPGDVHGIGTDPKLIRLAPMVWSNGGEVVDDDRTPTALTLDTPEASEALDFFASLVRDGLAPDDLAEQARDSEARFIDGNLGMFWSSRRDVPSFREAITTFDWDVVPFPLAPDKPDHAGERVTMLHADAFCLAADGRNVATTQEAWRFVEFATSVEGASILAESGRTVPINRSVANSPAFLRDDLPPANARVFLDNAEIVRATPSTATWNEVEGQADDILEELFYGRITVDRALERLAAIRFR